MSFPHEAALSRQPSGQVGLYEEDGVVLASSLVPRQMSSLHCRRRCDRNTKPACGAHTDEVNDETIKLTKVSPVLTVLIKLETYPIPLVSLRRTVILT